MTDPIQLQPDETIPSRPFSDPQASASDIATLKKMARKLRDLLRDPGRRLEGQAAISLHFEDEEGLVHRLILPNPQALHQGRNVVAVGFFGQIRSDIDHDPLNALEEKLVSNLPNAPGLLVYYNRHDPQEGYSNLVLFEGDDAKERWRDGQTHDQAVGLTPTHYHSVRLHNGLMPGGVFGEGKFILVRTKYYDFQEEPAWRAVREFGP